MPSKLPSLPRLPSLDFVSVGGGGFGGGFGGGVATPPTQGGSISDTIKGASDKVVGSYTKDADAIASTGLLGFLGLDILRLVLLIIGLICIIGAIYLFKPTSEFVAAPARAARDAVAVAA